LIWGRGSGFTIKPTGKKRTEQTKASSYIQGRFILYDHLSERMEKIKFEPPDRVSLRELPRLNNVFFNREDVVKIARDLIGKILVTSIDKKVTAGRIVETEAYEGVIDRASHAFGGRRTNRTKIMYHGGGTTYIYLCYGIHHLFNIVTNKEDIPHAILIRALEPLIGIETMLIRTKKRKLDNTLTRGPGNLSKAMGLTTAHTGKSLFDQEIYVADNGYRPSSKQIMTTTRIGVDYAGPDALLPYRFYLLGNNFVSRPLKK
jgi:DNA-3-methyladenine glycosylase